MPANVVDKGGRDSVELEQRTQHSFNVELDWVAYYEAFEAEHSVSTLDNSEDYFSGPVLVGNRLLFPDCWQYASLDYKGPEWPPPTDPKEIHALRWIYWRKRIADCRGVMLTLQKKLEDLRQAQIVRSIPLQQVTRFRNDEGEWVRVVDELQFDVLESRLDLLAADLEVCQGVLTGIEREDSDYNEYRP